MVKIRSLRLRGRNDFQVKYIRLSYRIRGRVARVQINNVARMEVLITNLRLFSRGLLPVKNNTVRRHIIKIFAYSAINSRANIPLLYSVLNPDTSSDSPSAKSNGVRFVSAKFVIYHIKKRGSNNKIDQV